MPAMLADIVEQLLAANPDVEIIGRTSPGEDALRAADASGADILVVSDAAGCVGQVLANSGLGIVSISVDGREADIVHLRHSRMTLDSSMIARLAATVRGRRGAVR